jgi:PPOX class probable F420-dependent enzyme
MTEFTNEQRKFLQEARAAAMITLRPDGTPHAVRIGVALVDGKLWSSGVPSRARTKHVRRDPRATVIVFSPQYGYLTIEGTTNILEGPDAPAQSVRLFRTMQSRPSGPLLWNGKETEEDAFIRQMVDEQRLIYEFEPKRVYGMV